MIHVSAAPADLDKPCILWRNLLAEGVLVASSAAVGTAAENALGPQTYDCLTFGAMPGTLSVTMGAAVSCDACAIAAHNLGSMGATVYVERWTGAAWEVMAEATPADDLPLMLVWPVASAAQWRLRFVGPAAVSVGVVFLGARLVIPATIRAGYVPADHAARVDLISAETLGGEFAGAVVWRRGREIDAALNAVPRAFVDGALVPFRDYHDAGGAFFWAGCPSVMPNDLAYCWRREGELRPSYSAGGYWADFSLRMAAYGA